MKGWAVLLILLLVGGYLYISGEVKVPEGLPGLDTGSSSGGVSSLQDEVKALGATEVEVSLSRDDALVRMGIPTVDDNLTAMLYDVAGMAYSSSHAKRVRVEAYYLGEPLLAVTVMNGDLENAELEDIRRPEFRIESDLTLFDSRVQSVELTNETASVTLEYLADREGFWKDYFAMAFVVLEDAPWVETVSITYLADNGTVTLSMSSRDIIRLQSGEVTAEELPGLVTVSKTGGR
ncbi:hypothetical protein [Thermococcus sp. 5-4]|uniref:hypothetical protein n=1 Tax=Thermococcus sp. 5-4 TaxID=2008440 RepID=UPI000B49B5B4|nr:hypothetical protein [Thermococcus sp. 5-4]ASA78168.1 hypothetical protein CDI07_07595 [Thermococcus sp. 5-4]